MTDTDRLHACQKKIEALEQEIRRLQDVESALRQSEEKHRLLLENANDAIFISQKLEALGKAAVGVVHDFNNLLMSIRADVTALQLRADTTAPQRRVLDGILHSVSSGAALTKQLLDFARKQPFEFRPTDLNRLLRQTADMFDRTQPGLKIQIDCEGNLWTVEADPPQLERVLLNLFVNAAQAMPGGGNLQLVTRNETIDRRQAQLLGLTSGQYVRVSVIDGGPGMDDATLRRVFEPFFTTKEKGTGLGLACAFGIVKSHSGSLVATSQKGKGARFDIFLPVSTENVCIDVPAGGGEQESVCYPAELEWLNTVLLVDDDPWVLRTVSLMLQKRGLRVQSAASAKSALALLEAQSGDIDLIILNVVMPDGGGVEAFHRMRALRPEAKFLLTSGCAVDDATCMILNGGGVGFIRKPYSEAALYRKIREIAG